MDKVHEQNISFLKNLFEEKNFDWINYNQSLFFEFFKSGGGTHLYLIKNGDKKFLARINYYEPKNEWGVKKQEFDILKLVEQLAIAPKVYFFDSDNSIKQDLTIVEYIEGTELNKVSEKNIQDLAIDLYKLHSSFLFDRTGDTLPPKDELPYYCDIYDIFSNGEDKQIEKYLSFEGIEKVIEPYNDIKKKLGIWFNSFDIFKNITSFCLCHADLKKENILVTENGIKIIDWECAGSDIPETDIGGLFSGCGFTDEQQEIFLKVYYKGNITEISRKRIFIVKKVLDFFHILEDYIILKRKKWDADKMLIELLDYEKTLK
ncbi:MAG: phosphotransferase [Patescibacteria group bacterium]|nr:phosphotransferase [Patescibacteria group bacterium]